MQDVIHERLVEDEGLERVFLPTGGATDDPKRRTSVFVSPDLERKSRVILIFGETGNPSGIISGRTVNGPGGINAGSAVSLARAISRTPDVGFVLLNMGEQYWWPEGQRTITTVMSNAVPLSSAVHMGRRHIPALNCVEGHADLRGVVTSPEGHKSPEGHVWEVFEDLVRRRVGLNTKLDIVAMADSCEVVEKFLDKEENWRKWKPMIGGMVLMGSQCSAEWLQNDNFKDFLAKV